MFVKLKTINLTAKLQNSNQNCTFSWVNYGSPEGSPTIFVLIFVNFVSVLHFVFITFVCLFVCFQKILFLFCFLPTIFVFVSFNFAFVLHFVFVTFVCFLQISFLYCFLFSFW